MTVKASPGSFFSEALESTLHLIEKRLRLYRRLLISVGVLVLVCPLGSLLFHSTRPLSGLILLGPLLGTFLLLDHRLICQWRTGILVKWRDRDLNLNYFAETLSSLRHLPPGLLAGLLGTLPASEGTSRLDQYNDEEKQQVMHRLEKAARQEERRTLAGIILLTLALYSLANTVISRSPVFLVLLALCILLLFFCKRS